MEVRYRVAAATVAPMQFDATLADGTSVTALALAHLVQLVPEDPAMSSVKLVQRVPSPPKEGQKPTPDPLAGYAKGMVVVGSFALQPAEKE